MAQVTTYASSAARLVPGPGPGSDEEDTRQLDQARLQNDLKLKTRFERIFRKYEHNFIGVGDEIDLTSGEIVVDNGHLRNMRDEADPGKSASSRFVSNFQESLEHEVEPDDGEEDSEGGDDYGDDDDDSGVVSGSDDDDDNSQTTGSQITMIPFPALNRPPPRLAQLLVGASGPADENDDVSQASEATGAGLLEQVPALRDSMAALTGRSRRPAIDADTIQALGTSIANQLAQLMAGPSKKKQKPRPTSRRGAIDPVWDYPDIDTARPQKRKRGSSPVAPPPISSPPMASPGQRSLWAPTGTRLSKRFQQADTPSLRRTRSSIIPSSAVRASDLMRCMNCSFSNSATWQVGPGGGVLCASCGKYYEHHGRMKPFDSPTPSVEEPDPSSAPILEMDLGDAAITALPITDQATLIGPQPAPDTFQEPPHSILPTEHHLPQIRSPARDSTPEVIIIEPEVSHISLKDATTPPTSTHARRIEHIPETPQGPMYFIDTPQSYSANTSRHIAGSRTAQKFSVEEDALIIKLKEQYDLPWHELALRLPQRTLFSVQNHYARTLFKHDCPGRDLFNTQLRDQRPASAASGQPVTSDKGSDWSYEQDELLYELREDKELEWAEIASFLPGHSIEAVEMRYVKLVQQAEIKREEQLPSGRQNCPWKPYEDALIVRLKEVDKLAWHHVAERVVDRSVQSIQKRYSRVLAPEKRRRAPSDLTRGTAEEIILEADPDLAMHLTPDRGKAMPFQPAEDELIRELVGMAKGKAIDWEGVAAQLPGRSVRSVFVRYTGYIDKCRLRPQAPQLDHPGSEGRSHQSIIRRDHSPSLGRNIRRTDLPPNYNEPDPTFPAANGSALTIKDRVGPGSRRPFTQTEDKTIMHLKASNDSSWDEISSQLPGRSAKGISQRFSELIRLIPMGSTNNAAPTSLRRVVSSPRPTSSASTPAYRQFTREEDDMLTHFYSKGVSWEVMAPYFDGRAPATLQDHWSTIIRPKARNSLPTSTNAGAGLLQTALENSRRRSEIHPGVQGRVFHPHYNDGEGNAEHPIMLNDDSDFHDPSEQLFGELHSSVLQDPTPNSQIDPQLLESDRLATNAQRYERLVRVAEQYAAQRNNSLVVRWIHETYQRNADDPRLQKLLELFNADASNTPLEIEWALDAFDLAHVQAGRVERGVDLNRPMADGSPIAVDGNGKGKEMTREGNVISAHAALPMYKPAYAQMLPPTATPGFSDVRQRTSAIRPLLQKPEPSTHVINGPATVPPKAHKTSTNHEVESRPRPAYTPVQGPVSAASRSHAVSSSSSSSKHYKRAPTALPAPGNQTNSATIAVQHKQATDDSIATQTSSTEHLQHQRNLASEALPDVPSRPKQSYHELAHMALSSQSKPLHFEAVCTWIEQNFEYYSTTPLIWRSEILKVLNGSPEFEQIGSGCVRKWRLKGSEKSAQEKRRVGRPRKSTKAAAPPFPADPADPGDDYIIPCSDGDVDERGDDAEEKTSVKPTPKKRGRPRKRTTGLTKSLQDLTTAKAAPRPHAVRNVPTQGCARWTSGPVSSRETVAPSKAPALGLTIEIADSDCADELSSTPTRKSPSREAASGKKVRFMDTVDVRGPVCDSMAHSRPSLTKGAQLEDESDSREPEGSSSSPSNVQTIAYLDRISVAKAKEAVPSSSPVFMKRSTYCKKGSRKVNITSTPAATRAAPPPCLKPASSSSSSSQTKLPPTPAPASTPFPQAKSRLAQLRRECTSTDSSPETPKTKWPRRHSTPTAFFSHRASPAPGWEDRFGLGRKRVVETPVRALGLKKDVEEDELA